MIVRPDEISASRAPSTRPLKHCEMKLGQLTTLLSALGLLCHARPCAGHPRLFIHKRDVDGRDTGVFENAVLRTAMPRHDGQAPLPWSRGAFSDQVYSPRLQPNASGFCISGSPGRTSRTSQKSSLFFMSLTALPRTMTTGRMHWWSCGR